MTPLPRRTPTPGLRRGESEGGTPRRHRCTAHAGGRAACRTAAHTGHGHQAGRHRDQPEPHRPAAVQVRQQDARCRTMIRHCAQNLTNWRTHYVCHSAVRCVYRIWHVASAKATALCCVQLTVRSVTWTPSQPNLCAGTWRTPTFTPPCTCLDALTLSPSAARAHRHLAGTTFDGRLWSTIRGVGPVLSNPVMAAGEEDILESNAPTQGCVVRKGAVADSCVLSQLRLRLRLRITMRC